MYPFAIFILFILLHLGKKYQTNIKEIVVSWLVKDGYFVSSQPSYYKVPILCFHNIGGTGIYSVSRKELRFYLQEIQRKKIQVISLRKLYEHSRTNQLFHKPSLVITVDDDYKNIVRVLAPILREFRYTATFFLYTKGIQQNPQQGTSWGDLQRLLQEGFDVQNHSHTHTAFHNPRMFPSRLLFKKRIFQEIIHSRHLFEKNLPKHRIWAFSYPMGYSSPELKSSLEEVGYELQLGTDGIPVDLRKPFTGIFHRYTIQKKSWASRDRMFQKQLQHSFEQLMETPGKSSKTGKF